MVKEERPGRQFIYLFLVTINMCDNLSFKKKIKKKKKKERKKKEAYLCDSEIKKMTLNK